jgi:hypothetical protein
LLRAFDLNSPKLYIHSSNWQKNADLRLYIHTNRPQLKFSVIRNECSVVQPISSFSQGCIAAGFPNQHWLKEEIVLRKECSVTQPISFFSQGCTAAGFSAQPWLKEKNRLADRALISKNDEKCDVETKLDNKYANA